MCGITGWVDWHRDLGAGRPVLAAMTGTMACRGPDDEGLWVSGHAAIGHRRLAVIDLVGGVQPMTTGLAGRRTVLTYSGEIYNYLELRDQLRTMGHRFETDSDTEVVLRSYLQWGSDCVERFNGMFAFAVWDEGEQRLLLARDRLGVKPLYYHLFSGGVLFGSEPKALLANPLFSPTLDAEGLAELFAMFGGRTPGHGVLAGLAEVRPGWTVTIDRDGVRQRRYWQLYSESHMDDDATTVATVRQTLADAVRRQLVADVPVCVLVSGGLDSSVVAALAGEAWGAELTTFSVDYAGSAEHFAADGNRPDRDAPFVRQLVDWLGSKHTDVVLDTWDLLGVQQRATAARDLPCLGDLDGSLFLLFQAIQGRSTVALSGESADEVFGGYAWFHSQQAIARDGFPWAMDDMGLANVLAPDVKRLVRPEEYVRDRYAEALAEVPRLRGETGMAARMREVGYLALTRFLPLLLDRKDRMSMAVGLEVRVPFCDHRLVQYVWNLPWELKCADGVPKSLLRAAAADLLPPDLLRRRKSMFPTSAEPGYDTAVRQRAMALVTGDSAVGPLLDRELVTALAEGDSKRPPWLQRVALAYLIQVDHWLRAYQVRLKVPV